MLTKIIVRIDVAVFGVCTEDPTGLIEWNFQGGAKEEFAVSLFIRHVYKGIRFPVVTEHQPATEAYDPISLKLCDRAVERMAVIGRFC